MDKSQSLVVPLAPLGTSAGSVWWGSCMHGAGSSGLIENKVQLKPLMSPFRLALRTGG